MTAALQALEGAHDLAQQYDSQRARKLMTAIRSAKIWAEHAHRLSSGRL